MLSMIFFALSESLRQLYSGWVSARVRSVDPAAAFRAVLLVIDHHVRSPAKTAFPACMLALNGWRTVNTLLIVHVRLKCAFSGLRAAVAAVLIIPEVGMAIATLILTGLYHLRMIEKSHGKPP